MKFLKPSFLSSAFLLLFLPLYSQTDLRIDFTGVQPTQVSVGSSFAITAAISLDANGTTPVPAGEVITAVLELRSPDGMIVATHTETWNGFPETGRSNTLDNDPRTIDQVIFQIPWSEAQKWQNANTRWSVSARVGGASAETDLTDNEINISFGLLIPNLEVTNVQTSGTMLPGSDLTAVVSVENTGQVRTQEGVFFPLIVIVRDAGGNVVDQETLILPDADQGVTPSLEPNQAYTFTMSNLRLPDDATGTYTVEAVVDPAFLFQGHIIQETVEDSEGSDNRQQQTITIDPGVVTLRVDPDSFKGNFGTFRGLEPVRLAFAVRNEGTVAIGTNDTFTVQVVLSEDVTFSTSDFILREFDLSGDALGANLLPNETVSFDWIQQMPDNLEGDYYLLVNIPQTDQSFPLDNTPIISLISRNAGTTDLQAPGYNGVTERPHTNNDGSWFVYEEPINGAQQIFLRDRFMMPDPPVPVPQSIPITVAYDGSGFGWGNANSLRPRISADGSTVVFHSRASNLVPSDENGQSDIFVYTAYNSELRRLIDFSTGQETNGGSFYADVNGDGTIVVFESVATNLQTNGVATSGRQIFLWDRTMGTIRAITSGNGESRRPTVDDAGKTITFASDATNLVADDTNGQTDVFVFHTETNATYRANIPDPTQGTEAFGGDSDQPEISGDGSTIVYRSTATNMVSFKGIAHVEVVNGGAGYFGSPTIEITDPDVNTPSAILSLDGGIDVYGQIIPGGVSIVQSGLEYTNPVVSIIPDPTQPAPTLEAVVVAHLSHPEGDIYKIKVADVNGSNALAGQTPQYSVRVSEREDVGGNMASRDPSVSFDGETIVYSTKSSNLLDENITRADGEVFYNTPIQQATARAILVGGIGEIEVQNTGSGYQGGFLKIEDYSGGGSGAIASYQVDTFGRISSVTMIASGSGYRLDTTVVTVDNPRGGTGFVAGTIRPPQDLGIGTNRTGGGLVHRIEMVDHGSGYHRAASTIQGLQSLISIDGDGVDVDSDGLADAKINASRIHLDAKGGVYLEQKFDIEILSTTSLATTVLTISDANQTIQVDFASNAALPFTIGLSGNDLSGIRDDLLSIIQTHWSAPSDLMEGPQIDDNSTGGTSFTFSALSGSFTTNNPSSIQVNAQSNLIFSGSGYTRATPVIAPPPLIYGFSEILSGTTVTASSSARTLPTVLSDFQTDDIYLFSSDTNQSERISRSSFGFPVNFLPSGTTQMPSNRFPSISGDGRHVFFSSDASGRGGLVFNNNTNQTPADNNFARDILHHDRKTTSLPTKKINVDMLYPTSSLNHEFSLGGESEMSFIVQVDYDYADLGRIDLYINDQLLGSLTEFESSYNSMRFTGSFPITYSGSHTLRAVAVDRNNQELGSSRPETIQVKKYTGSKAPTIDFDPLPFTEITSTSVLGLSLTASDTDGSVEAVQFYVNGQTYGEEILLPAGLDDDDFRYQTRWSPKASGIYSIHAVARDTSGNYITSSVQNVSVTQGTSPPSASFSNDFALIELNSSTLEIDLANDGSGTITGISLPIGIQSIGSGFYSKPEIQVSGAGNGATVTAVVDNINEEPVITGFKVENGGSGYNLTTISLKVVPTIQSIVTGDIANVTTRFDFDNAGVLTSTEYYVGADIGGPIQGSGYVISPRYLNANYFHYGRLPLEVPEPGATTSKVEVFNVSVSPPEGGTRAFILGGFTHASTFLEYNASKTNGKIVETGVYYQGFKVELPETEYPFIANFIPDDPGYYDISCYAKDEFGNIYFSENTTVLVKEMVGSNIAASFRSPISSSFSVGSVIPFVVEADSENDIQNVEIFMDGRSIGIAERLDTSNAYFLNFEITGIPEGEYEFSFVARDYNGNISGTFADDITTIETRQNKKITILPEGGFTPVIMSPDRKIAVLSADPPVGGSLTKIEVINGGEGFRFAPDIILQGGGGSGAKAVATIKNGVIDKIEVNSQGRDYDETVSIRVLDNGEEHPANSRAELDPVVENGRIVRIDVIDGGKNYFPTSNTIVVELDYNGTANGSGFIAGPIHTSDGIIEHVAVLEGGENYTQAPAVLATGGGQDFAEGEAIHIRVVANVSKGVSNVSLVANGVVQENRPFGAGGSNLVDVVANEPYYDLFWVPDRDPNKGIANTDGVGLWDLAVQVTDTDGSTQSSAPVQIRVVETQAPFVNLVTPEDGATYVVDYTSPISLVAEASDPDGQIREVQFLIDNKNTDSNGSASFVLSTQPYILSWMPESTGTYEIRAMAIDNAGVGSLSAIHRVTVQEPVGEKPYAVWHGPEDINNRMETYSYSYTIGGQTYSYSYSYSYNGRNYLYNDVEWGSTVYLNVQAFDPPFQDGNGSTTPGGIEKVTFWQNNNSLGKPEQIGEAMSKYNNIYAIQWKPRHLGETIVWAEILDLDGNLIRTEVRSFNVGTNIEKPPSIDLVSIRQMGKGKYAARVNFENVITSSNFWYVYSIDDWVSDNNAFLQGEFSIDLLINGVVVDRVDLKKLPQYVNVRTQTNQGQNGGTTINTSLVGEQYMQQIGGDTSNALTYEFTDVVIEEPGSLEIKTVLMSRQGKDNFRKVVVSDSKTIEINPNDLFTEELPNIFPEGSILSPKPSDLARASAFLTQSTVSTAEDYGLIDYIMMDNIGSGYDPNNLPNVVIQGGGGTGATASVELINGAISSLLIEDYGTGYTHDEQNNIYEWITKADATSKGQGFQAYVKVNEGVLSLKQTVENGAILNSGYGYKNILNKNGFIRIFDYNLGNGAQGYVSEVDDNGGIIEITITNGGQNYNALDKNTSVIYVLDSYNGQKSEGYGFESGVLLKQDGVVNSYSILNSGSGYELDTYLVPVDLNEYGIWKGYNQQTIQVSIPSEEFSQKIFLLESKGTYQKSNFPESQVYELNASQISDFTGLNMPAGNYAVMKWLEMAIDSQNGTGFKAKVLESGIKDGALSVKLTNPGMNYSVPPKVILEGGGFLSLGSLKKEPLQITQGSQVLLMADVFDFDGRVESVRFFGNGNDLGIQTVKQLDTIVVTAKGTGYTNPPQVILEGGGGTGAEAIAALEPPPRGQGQGGQQGGVNANSPRGVEAISITNVGENYFQAPSVIITGGNGAGAKARARLAEKTIETFAEELIPGTQRWGLPWVPNEPGTYLVSVEVTDDDGDVTFIPSNAEIVVLPRGVSKVPQINLISEFNGMSFTSKSKLRFTARAGDQDGKLEYVQFYVNGDPLGGKIYSNYLDDQFQQPYSVEFSPTESGVYTVFAIAKDNSGNYVMSDTVTFTTTTGAGSAPKIIVSKPTMSAEASIQLDYKGSIIDFNLTNPGSGYVEPPEINLFGEGYGASLQAKVNTDRNSAEFGTLYLDTSKIVSGGLDYKPDTNLEFVGGFEKIKASGQVAKANVITTLRRVIGGTEYSYDAQIVDGGSGYTVAPRVLILNGPPGMAATASIDPATARVVDVSITNQGTNRRTRYRPEFSFIGGLNFSETLIEALVSDEDNNASISAVTFYVNGTQIESSDANNENPDRIPPYRILWSPDGPGIYELYATAQDSDGNLYTSPVIRREAYLSSPPYVEFNPRDRATGFISPDLIQSTGNDPNIGIINTDEIVLDSTTFHSGSGYFSFPSVEFYSNGVLTDSRGQAIMDMETGKLVGIKILNKGTQNLKYNKLTGTVTKGSEQDLLVGNGTSFLEELKAGQTIFLGEKGKDYPYDPLVSLKVERFQSLNELIFSGNFPSDVTGTDWQLYSYGTEIVVKGGMDTAAGSIPIRFGDQLSLGVFAEDPDGSFITKSSFTLFVNGEIDPDVAIQGSGPFYQVLWSPDDLGDYTLRLQVTDSDGAQGFSQPMQINVANGFSPSISMISPINEAFDYENEDPITEYAFGSTLSFTFEAKDFDGIVNEVRIFANSELVGVWPPQNLQSGNANNNTTNNPNAKAAIREGDTGRFSVNWDPLYPGTYSISASVEDNSEQLNYSSSQVIKIKAAYRDGSRPPVSLIKYPIVTEDVSQSAPDQSSRPLYEATSASVIPIIANAYDRDGSLENLTYYVDGQRVPIATAYLQILEPPLDGETFVVNDGLGISKVFEFDSNDQVAFGNYPILITSMAEDLIFLDKNIQDLHDGNLSSEDNTASMLILEKYGNPRHAIPSLTLFEEIINGLRKDAIDNQRNLVIEAVEKVSGMPGSSLSDLSVSAEIIGFNGVMFRHLSPDKLVSKASITSQSSTINVKGFSNGILRYPSRDSRNYHFTQLWSPPMPGVFTIISIVEDSSGNRVMSSPVSLTTTFGNTPPTVKMTSPLSGTQRSVSMVGEHASGDAIQILQITQNGTFSTGRIGGIDLQNRGTGYVAPPTVHFFGSGFGASATATIVEDPADPRYGQIEEITIDNSGQGYYGDTVVEFRGGLGNEAVFMNAVAEDQDGEVNQVQFLKNGDLITTDLTQPFAVQDNFSVGYFELLALAMDDAGNIVASEPSRMNISTIRGAAPSGFIIYPLPPVGYQAYLNQGQDYFWDFVRDYAEFIKLQEETLGNREESFSLAANSFIHLSARATDSDGAIREVSFYLNNKFLGIAERQNDSHHYVLPVDLSDFGEQPVYRIDTMIKDQAGNLVIPNNPIYLDVLPATGSRPDIEIVLPTPDPLIIPKYSMGGQVSMVVDVTPVEGTLQSVGLFANGRFIGDAELQNELAYGAQRYALNWQPENPGKYTLSGSVTDNMGAVVFTSTGSLIEVVDDDYDLISNIEIVPNQVATTQNAVSRGSSLIANAEFLGSEGRPILMKKVDFFLNGTLLDTQTQPPFSFLFRPPSLQDRFVSAPLSWEVKTIGQSLNDRIGTAIEYGTVLGVTELPQLVLSPIEGPSSLPDKHLIDGMSLSLSVVAEGSDDVLQSIDNVTLYGNGVEIVAGTPTPNFSQGGIMQSITYQFDWLVDHSVYAKNDGSVEVVAIGQLAGDATGTGSLPVIASNTERIVVDYEGSQSLAMLFTQVTGETLSSQDIDEVIDEINSTGVISSTFDPVDALIQLVNNSDRLNQRVDVTAAYHVSIGKWHDSYSTFQNHVSNFVPLESMGSEEWVKDYIDYLLTSPDEGYLARFGVVPFLVGDESRKNSHFFADNRMDFASQCLENKYSIKPDFQQVFQGSNRMLSYWSDFEPNYWELRGATGTPIPDTPPRRDTIAPRLYGAGECAVDFIFNLAKEVKYEGGLPFILYTLNQRELYRIVTYYFLYFGENLSEVNSNEIKYLASLGERKALEVILNDYRWTSQSNQIWANSTPHSIDYWKNETWFGSFMDKYFPWTFHSSLGWIYIQGSNPMDFWFYSSKQDTWLWTGANIFPYAYSSEKSGWVYFETSTQMLYDFNEAKWRQY